MAPTTTKQVVVSGKEKGFDELKLVEAPIKPLGDKEVLVRIHAASLNYRDLVIPKGLYPFPNYPPVVGASDGAGEVVQVGSKVTRFQPGDRVITLFNQGHQFGGPDLLATKTGLGGVLDGTLRQYGAFDETGLVRAPSNLSHIEASTLTCAALTAWNALYGLRPLKPGETVLTQGTGGVSLFALQFAKVGGARVIATTSSASKAETLRKLGADHVINYREDANWGATARTLTPGGQGVDHVLEVGGASTTGQSLEAIRMEGIVSIIGFLGGTQPKESVLEALNKICTIRGVYVGSRQQLEEMVAAIEANDIKPVVDDKVFTLETVKEAYQYMWDQKHFGKLVVKIDA